MAIARRSAGGGDEDLHRDGTRPTARRYRRDGGENDMNYRVLTVCAASLSLSAVTPVLAQGSFGPLSIESCPDYVARATSQVQMATGCSFTGGRWSIDAADHSGSVPIKNCREYAARSRSQVELAQSLESDCVFEGMRWSSNLVQHLNWCNRTPANRHELEDAARRRELAACKPKPR
jgi:hypothetical protein